MMRHAGHLDTISSPPIVTFKQKIASLLPRRTTIIDLTQAVPSWPAPPIIRQILHEEADRDAIFYYTEDQGLVELRQAIARRWQRRGIAVSTDRILITAGANMAFTLVMMAILEPGSDVILPTPYYFNHEMAVRLCHGNPLEVQLDPDNGFLLSPESIEAAMTEKTKAIVLVSPNNPTGALYSADQLRRIFQFCKAHDIICIHDETYAEFDDEFCPHHSLLAEDRWEDTLISIHSFSKTYSMTGMRLGYLVCHEPLMEQLLKVQDTLVICAPHLAQIAASEAIEEADEWLQEKKRLMRSKVMAFRRCMQTLKNTFAIKASGAFFGYVRHGFESTAEDVALSLARQSGILVLPGSFFGSKQEKFLRFAFGNMELQQFDELANRLQSFTFEQ